VNPGYLEREERTDAPEGPDARVLALDVGLYGHRGSISAMFWYQQGGHLHAHRAELLPEDATLTDQLDVLESWAEAYPEYWRISPVVIIGVTVLSPVGKRHVREHLAAWYNPPGRRRLVTIGDYAGEQAGTGGRGLLSRKKLRDHIAVRLAEHTLALTPLQHQAVSVYTGKREKPGRDAQDEWRTDETDAVALPVALSCLAATSMLPPPQPTAEQDLRAAERAQRAWQLERGVPADEAWDLAIRQGHPHRQTGGDVAMDTNLAVPTASTSLYGWEPR
jgi:hypothetical protein